MVNEEKQILIKDICARLPYYPMIQIYNDSWDGCRKGEFDNMLGFHYIEAFLCDRIEILPYLRPMSSMTEAELNECVQQSGIRDVECPHWHDLPKEKQFDERLKHSMDMFLVDSRTIDWLNKKMFDYRGLIRVGLALEAPEGMYESYRKAMEETK